MSLGRRAEEIARDIADRIRSGEWQVLPTIEQMMPVYSCKGGTLSRILQHLRDQGVVVKNEARRGPPRWVIATPEVPDVVGYAGVIAAQVADRVAAREWDVLPTIDELKVLCQTSLATVVEALRELERRGLVTKDLTARGPGRWMIVDDSRPLPRSRSEAVAAEVHAKVTNGEWAQFPPVRELRRTIKAHANAVNGALKLLAAEGVIERAEHIPGRPWVLVAPPDGPRCRRMRCVRPPVGRGLCVHHYALWQGGEDPLDLPGDEAVDPGIVAWEAPKRDRSTGERDTVEDRHRLSEVRELPPRKSVTRPKRTSRSVRRVATDIEENVRRGVWTDLPTTREMYVSFGVDTRVLVGALRLLEEQGVVEKEWGRWHVVGADVDSPRYAQVANDLAQRIQRGEMSVLPTLVRIQDWYRVSKSVVDAAMRLLSERGVVVRRDGRWVMPGAPAHEGLRGERYRYLMSNDGTGPTPVAAVRVADDLAGRIRADELVEFPSSLRIADFYGVNSHVVLAATRSLYEAGLVVKEAGRWVLTSSGEQSPVPQEEPGYRAHAIEEDMLARIQSGEWRVFPRSADLAQIYQTSEASVGAAVRALREQGVLTIKGRRTVVVGAEPPSLPERIADELAERIRSSGNPELPSRARLAVEYATSSGTINGALGLLGEHGIEFQIVYRHMRVTKSRPDPYERATAVAADIVERIRRGEWTVLPVQRELQDICHTNRTELTAAMRLLSEQGVVEKCGRRWGIPDGTRPVFRAPEIAEDLAARVDSGELAVFPGQEEICAFYRCARDTGTAATRLLAERGRVVKGRRWVLASSADVTQRDGNGRSGLVADLGSEMSRAQEIAEDLVVRARSGALPVLPSHEAIAAVYRCRHDTVTAATRLLAERGVVVKKRRWVWADSFEVTPGDELLR